jgi:hypothetical protein
VRFVPYTRRRGARVSWLSLKTNVDGFSDLDLKTGSYSLMIWTEVKININEQYDI